MIELSVVRDLVAIFGVIAGFTYYVLTVRNNQKNQQLTLETRQAQLYMTLYNTVYNQNIWDRIIEARGYAFTGYEDFMEKYGPNSNPEAYSKLQDVWWFFTEMGVLVYRGYLDLTDCMYLVSSSPLDVWIQYEPVIEGLREHHYRSGAGHISWEYLAKTMYQTYYSGGLDDVYAEFERAIPDISLPTLEEFTTLSREKKKQT